MNRDRLIDHFLLYVIPSVISMVVVFSLFYVHRKDCIVYEYMQLYTGVAVLSGLLLLFPLLAGLFMLSLSSAELPGERKRRLRELLEHRIDYLIFMKIFLRTMLIFFTTIIVVVFSVVFGVINMVSLGLVVVGIIWGSWYVFLSILALSWVVEALYKN